MSFLGWFRSLRIDLFSSSEHWAEVMVEADTLAADYELDAAEVAHQRERAASGAQSRALFRDVGFVLEARDGAVEGEAPVRAPLGKPAPKP